MGPNASEIWLQKTSVTAAKARIVTPSILIVVGFMCLRLMGITLAISGSRPIANHTARFYRESAALLCSPCLGWFRNRSMAVRRDLFPIRVASANPRDVKPSAESPRAWISDGANIKGIEHIYS
jgi:hypothetical protein